MNYYIAKDRFGNYDLCHYGVKGMKWGVVNEDPLIGRLSGTGKSLSETNQRMSGSTNYNYRIRSSGLSSQVKVANVSKASGKQSVAEKSGDEELDAQVAEAEAKYKEALTSMQMMARISLSQGFSPNSDPDYISARKAVIKAKYELDKLRIDQQAKAAQNPPTMAEQKQAMDTQAKEERKEAKKTSSGVDDDYAAFRRAVINQSFAGREMPESMKKLRDSKK